MRKKVEISQLIRNFDYEVEDAREWIDVHINLMFIEIHEIQNIIYIFDVVSKEWDRRTENGGKVNYSAVRTILYEALPYKIVLGLSKIFVGSKEYSLPKTINVISQMDEYKNNSKVQETVTKIRNFLETSKMVAFVTTYRDQFFAHLDKECVLSDCRIDSTMAVKQLEKKEIEEGAHLIGELYEVCFDCALEYRDKELSQEDIIYTFFWR